MGPCSSRKAHKPETLSRKHQFPVGREADKPQTWSREPQFPVSREADKPQTWIHEPQFPVSREADNTPTWSREYQFPVSREADKPPTWSREPQFPVSREEDKPQIWSREPQFPVSREEDWGRIGGVREPVSYLEEEGPRYPSEINYYRAEQSPSYRPREYEVSSYYRPEEQVIFDSISFLIVSIQNSKYLPEETSCLCGRPHIPFTILALTDSQQVNALEAEVVYNGFQDVLSNYQGLRAAAQMLICHPMNKQSRLTLAEIMAVKLHTDTTLQQVFRKDMMDHNPRWRVLYYLIRQALCKGGQPRYAKHAYRGLRNVTTSNFEEWVSYTPKCKWQVFFYLPSVTSATTNKQIAVDFAARNTLCGGCLFDFSVPTPHKDQCWLDGQGRGFPGMDVSWISRYPQEQEIALVPFAVCTPEVEIGIYGMRPKSYRSRAKAIQVLKNNIQMVEETTSSGLRVMLEKVQLYIITQRIT